MSCLGKVCTVQHRNPDCRGGKTTDHSALLECTDDDQPQYILTNESMDRHKIKALIIQRDDLKAEVQRLNALLCTHRQSRCVDCIENENKGRTFRDVLKDMSREGPLNMLVCTKCEYNIMYTGHDHELPCHNCNANTVGMSRMYDFS